MNQSDSFPQASEYTFTAISISPEPLKITVGLFRIFSKIRGDIRGLRYTTGVNDTGGKWKNLQAEKM
jgi:hypothetical protein